MTRRLILFLVFQLLIAAPPANYKRHSRGTICLYQAIASMKKEWKQLTSGLERTIESEIKIDQILPYITTDDGTMKSLVKYHGPEWFEKLFPNRLPQNVSWAGQRPEVKKKILNEITKNQTFSWRREISGLRLKEGKHPLSDFQGYVELVSPNDAGNVHMVELHLRGKERASTLALKARDAAKQVGVDKISLHAHITFKVRTNELTTAPFLASIRHGDYIRRSELYSQMHSLFETADDLSPVKDSGSTYFHAMESPRVLVNIMRDFF